MPMDEHNTMAALNVVDFLLQHPITKPVWCAPNTRVQPDLQTIMKKIYGGQYNNFKEFESDLEIMWTTLETNGHFNLLYTLTSMECRRLTAKAVRNLAPSSMLLWTENFLNARAKMWAAMKAFPCLDLPPDENKLRHPTIKDINQSLFIDDPGKKNRADMTEKEVYNFISAVEMITESKDIHELISIMTKMQPELETNKSEVAVEINNLKPDTVTALIEHIRKCLKNMNLNYPD